MLDISGWEFITLGIIAVLIFGPDKLPKFAADAGKFLNQVRAYVNGAKTELTKELGPEFADVKVSDLTPRGMMKKALGENDPFEELRQSVDIRRDVDQFRDLRNPLQFQSPRENGSANGNGARHREDAPDEIRKPKPVKAPPPINLDRPVRTLAENEVPPFDSDAT